MPKVKFADMELIGIPHRFVSGDRGLKEGIIEYITPSEHEDLLIAADYDTLIKNHTVPELVAVLAHEVGHYKLNHIISNLLVSIITTGLMLFLMSKILFSILFADILL